MPEGTASGGHKLRRRLGAAAGLLLAAPVLLLGAVWAYVAIQELRAEAALAALVEDGLVTEPRALWANRRSSPAEASEALGQALQILDSDRMSRREPTEPMTRRSVVRLLEATGEGDSEALEDAGDPVSALRACGQAALPWESVKRLPEWAWGTASQAPGWQVPPQIDALLEAVFARVEQLEPPLDRALAAETLVLYPPRRGSSDPEREGVRALRTALRARAVRAGIAGELATAWGDLARLLRLARVVWWRGSVNLWARLDATRSLAILELLLPLGAPDSETLEAVRHELVALEDPALLVRPFAELFTVHLAVLGALLGEEAPAQWLATLDESYDPAPFFWALPLRHDRAAAALWMAARLRCFGAPTLAEAIARDARGDPTQDAWTPFGQKMRLNMPLDWVREDFDNRARVRLARVALELVARGRPLPAALTDPPADPCAPAEPIRWRKLSPRTGLLWSVGADGQDQGGVRAEEGEASWEAPGGADVVFRVTLPPAD